MKQLPTETVIHILGNLSKRDLKSVGLAGSRYSALARPLLFRHIRLFFDTNILPFWVTRIAQSSRHAAVIKIIEIGDRWSSSSSSCLQPIRILIQSALTLEQFFIGAPNSTIPQELLDPAIFPNLKKLTITADSDYDHLAVHFLPHCPHLVDLELPYLRPNFSVASTPPSFMNRLRRFRGPPYFLSYMANTDRALQHFSSTLGLTDAGVLSIGNQLGFGEELLSFHVVIAVGLDTSRFNWVQRHCITPSLIPSLFPNLRSVAWFLVNHQLPDETNESNSAEAASSDPLLSPNAALLAVIKQLPHLRRLCLVSYHCAHDGSFPDVITAFLTVLQNESDSTTAALPHLHIVSIWAGGSDPWSYSWRKRYIDSPENGRTRTAWFTATNQIVNPEREPLS